MRYITVYKGDGIYTHQDNYLGGNGPKPLSYYSVVGLAGRAAQRLAAKMLVKRVWNRMIV